MVRLRSRKIGVGVELFGHGLELGLTGDRRKALYQICEIEFADQTETEVLWQMRMKGKAATHAVII
jgi:hypothetical protein